MPIDLPSFTGQVPHDVEQAIMRLRGELETALAQSREALDRLAAMPAPLTLAQISAALGATGSNPIPTAELLNTNPAPTQPPPNPPPEDGIPDHEDIIASTMTAMGIGPASTDEEMFRFIQTAVQNINTAALDPPGLTCGLTLGPPAGSNSFTCAGVTYKYQRVCYNNGHLFDVVENASFGGSRQPQWLNNGFRPELYHVATDPSTPC